LTQDRADFDAIFEPVYRFLNETTDRSPLTDWYETGSARKVGFTARPVVGGVFLQMLYNREVWQKWAQRDLTKAANWAPIPKPPKINIVVPAADKSPSIWRYTTTKPEAGWANAGFDDSKWSEGKSGFGTKGTPGAVIGTTWSTADIWLRREIEIKADELKDVALWLHHDDDVSVEVNGVELLKASGWTTQYEAFPLTSAGRSALQPGKNIIAIHCHQISGGQYVDCGIITLQAQ
jgi:hypothetical protein